MDNLLRPLRPVEGTTSSPSLPPHPAAAAAAPSPPALHLHSHPPQPPSAISLPHARSQLQPQPQPAAFAPPPRRTAPAPGPIPAGVLAETRGGKKKTCLQCRVRKVKCDGRHSICQNCERLEFECSFQQSPGQSSAQYATKLPERRRRMQACLNCRSKKIRCWGELPECSNCVKKGLRCAYPESRKRVPGGGGSQHGDSCAGSVADHDGPSDDIHISGAVGEAALGHDTMAELVDDYFLHLYPLPSYAFLHKQTVVQRCQDRTIDTPLKLAICALTSLLLRRTDLCHDIWVQQAEQSILHQLGQPSIFRLQALLLIVRYRIESGDFPTAFMLAALAARSAVGLRLNFERNELSALAQEARRRLFWSLFLLDDFFCVGLREFELCPKETIHLQLPCDEDMFQAGQICRTGCLQEDPLEIPATIGLRGVFLRLVSIRREIMRFVRQVGLQDLQVASIPALIARFEQQLQALQAGLSRSDQYSVANLAQSKLQVQFTMLHASWNQCFCDLYRSFIDGRYSEAGPEQLVQKLSPGSRAEMQRRCFEHAENIIQVVADFWNNVRRDSLLERDTAVCAFEAARLVLFSASIGSSTTSMDTALRKANLCLDVITHYFSHSAATKALRNKLERVIGSYSARLALQHKDALREPDYAEGPRPSARISQYANSRQRLSVQSLLLQSDFVDDSDQIGMPPPPPLSSNNTTSNTTNNNNHPYHPQGAVVTGVPPRDQPQHSGGDGDVQQQQQPIYRDGASTGSAPSEVPALDDRMSLDDIPDETKTPAGANGADDASLELNPWMGFPGKDDVYGIPGFMGALDEEY